MSPYRSTKPITTTGPNASTGLRKPATALVEALEQQRTRLAALLTALEHGRNTFMTVRSAELEQASAGLWALAQRVQEVEAAREAALEELRVVLGAAQPPSVRELAPRLPEDLRRRLCAAAERVRAVAEKLRVEQRLGARLLEFSAEAQVGMFKDLLGAEEPVRGYDRSARVLDAAPGVGRLISGKV